MVNRFNMSVAGENVPRLDGPEKVSGRACYVDDICLPGMWHGVVVRSQIPHGRIKNIFLDPGFDWSRVVTAGEKDIPGRNCVAMIEEDLPLIVSQVTKHVGEAVMLIAAPARELALEARRHVKIDYDEFEPVFRISDSRSLRTKIRGEDNIIAHYEIEKGDIENGFSLADEIVEGIYSTGHQEHMYIEPQGVIASLCDDGMLKIIGSLQCPYYVSRALSILMGMPEEKISVRQAAVGGAFGGKEDYPSILAGYASVLARKAGRPVKIVYERPEDTEVTTKRHPAVVRHRSGVKKDGTITAMEIIFELDGGAYVTLSPVVLSRGAIHSAGPYRCENIRIEATAWATNTPPNGAFRGFGAPQSFFPLEVHIDRVAEAIGMSPLEFRKKNCLKIGDVTATGQILKESVGATKVLQAAAAKSKFKGKFSKNVVQKKSRIRSGIGISLCFHGAGFTGSGEEKLKGLAGLRLDPDGKITVLTACTEMGQGAHTVLPQMVADYLGVDLSCIGIETPDTALVPNSGPTVASRTTMIMGVVLGKCAASLKKMFSSFSKEKIGPNLVKAYLKANGPLTVIHHYDLPPDIHWSDETYKGDAYPTFAYGADVAEVEVDMDTFEVCVKKMWMAVEVGRAINPKLAAGQIEGGTLQALGWALMERHELDKGHFKTSKFQNYIIPTALDAPEFETIILEEPYSLGPMGAKGLGELPMDGPAPAIANAIYNATGLRVCELPITPEKLFNEWKNGPKEDKN